MKEWCVDDLATTNGVVQETGAEVRSRTHGVEGQHC